MCQIFFSNKIHRSSTVSAKTQPEIILYNGKVWSTKGFVSAVSIADNKIQNIGTDTDVLADAQKDAKRVNLQGRTVIPGLNDSHIHLIRGGLNFNLELRWDGVKTLSEALQLLQWQVARTPAPQWVRVVGGWCEYQFKEKRLPTLDEINKIAPDTPVFLLHLYDRALLNAAALRAVGYDKNTPDPPGGEIERDKNGNPTGLLIAKPNAMILYATLAKGPKLSFQDQSNSTRQFMRELNRLAVTSVIDAGGGYQKYPEDYKIIEDLHRQKQMTVRIAYNLFTQNPGHENADFEQWTKMVKPGAGDHLLRLNGAGEMLVFSAADFEDFREPMSVLPSSMESELEVVVRTLAQARWPFRLHATYNETIERALNVFESVNRDIPFDGLRWFFDHAETITERNIERVKALGGGIAVQHRMAYQGEYYISRYGADAAATTPPFKQMLKAGLPVGAGTDATRVASYNPFVALSWLTTGRTVGGTNLYPKQNLLSREEALELYTNGSAWFSGEEHLKGRIEPGYLADLAVLSKDYFSIEEEDIPDLESLMTIVDGKIVYAASEFENLAPPLLPVSPTWAPSKSAQTEPKNTAQKSTWKSSCTNFLCDARSILNFAKRDCDCFVF
ncbi:MAG: amidohydrolase [Cyanobacteria bacterium SZAS-4]|nr:amidohydrolase [Cyanobacteria bacterium SZAS-4]